MLYEDSKLNQTAGVSLTGTAGIPDKQVARAFCAIQINTPVALGIITVNFKWKDRQGVTRTKQALSTSLATAGNFSADSVLYFYDTGAQNGVLFQYEVNATAVGSFDYDVAVGLEELFTGN